jgi:hypothetical protein
MHLLIAITGTVTQSTFNRLGLEGTKCNMPPHYRREREHLNIVSAEKALFLFHVISSKAISNLDLGLEPHLLVRRCAARRFKLVICDCTAGLCRCAAAAECRGAESGFCRRCRCRKLKDQYQSCISQLPPKGPLRPSKVSAPFPRSS